MAFLHETFFIEQLEFTEGNMHSRRRHMHRRFASKFFVMTIVIFMSHRPASAQGLLGNSVLQLSPSAVANGMANGVVAASTEASAIHYNPAALTRLGRFAIEGNTFELFQDARYHHVAGAFQTPFFSRLWLGAAYSRVGLTTRVYGYDGEHRLISVSEVESYEWTLSIAAAAKMSHHASLGVAFKYGGSGSDLFPESAKGLSTYALDLGFLYEGLLPVAHISRREGRQALPSKNGTVTGLAPGFSLGVTLTNISLNSIFNDAERDLLTRTDVDPVLPAWK
jgi:long-subunit fatty acid transport protein